MDQFIKSQDIATKRALLITCKIGEVNQNILEPSKDAVKLTEDRRN